MKSITVDQKRGRGRPATGRDPAFSARIPAEALESIDALAKAEGVSRGEMVRKILTNYVKRQSRK